MKVQTGSGSGGYINHLPAAPLVTPRHHVAAGRRVCRRRPTAAAACMHGAHRMHRPFNIGVRRVAARRRVS